MQEKARIFKSSWYYMQKVAYCVFKESAQPRPTSAVSPT